MTDARIATSIDRITTILRAENRKGDAEQLGKLVAAKVRAKPAVFVAGEDKRGKSNLVNALLAKPDLSPTGVEVVTGSPITFFAARSPAAMVFRYGEQDPAPYDFDEARKLATVVGNPGNMHNVRAVALGADSPILEVVNLVDTPGVGGLSSGHGALTLQSLASADALVFVIAAGAQFRAAELAFLRQASSHIDTVIIALTKTDLFRGWRTILDDNMRILKEQAPRFAAAPVVPVSSLLALRGLSSGDLDEAQELRQESGVAELEQVIRERVVARATVLRDANAVRAGIGSLTGVERTLQEKLVGLGVAGDGNSRAALEAERSRLHELQADRSDWLNQLDSEVRKLTLERAEAATKGSLEIRRAYDARLKELSKEDVELLPGELTADLTRLAGELNDVAADRLSSFVSRVLTEIDDASKLDQTIRELTRHSLRDELESISLGGHDISSQDKLSILSSFSTGRSLGSFAGVAASAFLAPPIGLVLGFGLGGMFAFQAFRSRGQTAFSSEFQGWMNAQIAHAQSTINTTFQHRMIDVQSEIRRTIQTVLGRRERELAEAIDTAKAALEQEVGRRREEQQRLERNLQAVRQLRQQTANLLAELTAG
jgi:hypothetical protein